MLARHHLQLPQPADQHRSPRGTISSRRTSKRPSAGILVPRDRVTTPSVTAPACVASPAQEWIDHHDQQAFSTSSGSDHPQRGVASQSTGALAHAGISSMIHAVQTGSPGPPAGPAAQIRWRKHRFLAQAGQETGAISASEDVPSGMPAIRSTPSPPTNAPDKPVDDAGSRLQQTHRPPAAGSGWRPRRAAAPAACPGSARSAPRRSAGPGRGRRLAPASARLTRLPHAFQLIGLAGQGLKLVITRTNSSSVEVHRRPDRSPAETSRSRACSPATIWPMTRFFGKPPPRPEVITWSPTLISASCGM